MEAEEIFEEIIANFTFRLNDDIILQIQEIY
jgi:hypothetical protein